MHTASPLHPDSQPLTENSTGIIEKNPHIRGPMHFKPMLFKGQQYVVAGIRKYYNHFRKLSVSFLHNQTYTYSMTEQFHS